MLEWVEKLAIVGVVAFLTLPVLLAAFGFYWVRANREAGLLPPLANAGRWLLRVSGAGFLLFLVGAIFRLPALGWGALGLFGAALLLSGRCYWKIQARPLKGITGAVFANLGVLVLFIPFALWLSAKALQDFAYSNTNEAEVREALAKNPSDPAAHSSLAHIDMMRGDHAGEILEWQQVLRVEPNNEDALFLLACRLKQQGKGNEAQPLFQKLAMGHGPYADAACRWLAKINTPTHSTPTAAH